METNETKSKSEQQKTLAQEALSFLISRIESTEKFVLEQAPAICQEVVTSLKIDSISSVFLSTFFLVLSSILSPYFISKAYNYVPARYSDDGQTGWIFASIAAVIILVVSFIAFYCSAVELFKLYKCPKLCILGELAKLTKRDSK